MAILRPALEQGCWKQRSSARKIIFTKESAIRSSSVFEYLQKENRCTVFRPQEGSEFGIAQRFSLRKYPKKCTDLDMSLFYILISGAYGKFARQNTFLALGVCFPQTCSSAGCMFATSRSRLHYYWRIVSFPQQQIRWVLIRLIRFLKFEKFAVELFILNQSRFFAIFAIFPQKSN